MNGIVKSEFAQYDQHYELVDPMRDDDSDIVEGWAIRSEDVASFLFDLRKLIARYGVTYDELVDADWQADSSLGAAVRSSMAGQGVEAIGDTIDIEME